MSAEAQSAAPQDDLSKMIESFDAFMKREEEMRRFTYPIEVFGVDWRADLGVKSKSIFALGEAQPGSFVAVRSCKEGHGDKTRLGLLVGYVPIHTDLAYDKKTKRLRIDVGGDNPAIFVFELGEVVLGVESFWGPIKDEKHLRQITDNDIENIWYVKALKAMEKAHADAPKGPSA